MHSSMVRTASRWSAPRWGGAGLGRAGGGRSGQGRRRGFLRQVPGWFGQSVLLLTRLQEGYCGSARLAVEGMASHLCAHQ